MAADVVAVKGNVDRAGAADEALGAEALGEAVGEDDAAIGDAQQKQARGLVVATDNCGNDGAEGLFDHFGVVFRVGSHEPKVLKIGTGLVQCKGEKGTINGEDFRQLQTS